MPEGAVYVGRPSQWGNPFRWIAGPSIPKRSYPADEAVVLFREYLAAWAENDKRTAGRPIVTLAQWLEPLRSATALACWCPLDQPCHADVLIELLEARR